MAWLTVTGAGTACAGQQRSQEEPSLRERLDRRISVEVRKTPIEDVVRLITEQADVDVVMSPNVEGETTVKLTDVSLEEALRSILEVHGYDYTIGDNIIRVLTRDEMPQVPEREMTEVLEITYADVSEVVKSLDKFKSSTGSVSHIQGTSHILVTDKEKKVQAMTRFIDEIDRMTPQVLVEARIYDVTSKDRFDIGVQWEAGTGTTYDAFGEPDIATRTEPFATGGFNGTIAKAENTTGAVRLGWLTDKIDIDILLKAQQENVDAKLLANPRILVLDNETADIKIISEIPYQELTESALGGAIGTTAFREVGVELQVTPHLARRDEMIRLHLQPVFSVVTGEVQVAGIGVTYPQPVVDRRQADTKLLVKNGQTVVLGGLRKKEVAKQINKIPLLGDLPLAGPLFRFKGENTVNSELLVSITPWIVEDASLSDAEAAAYTETTLPRVEPQYTEAELREEE
jgi:type IV pilus assembly protein PilQ